MSDDSKSDDQAEPERGDIVPEHNKPKRGDWAMSDGEGTSSGEVRSTEGNAVLKNGPVTFTADPDRLDKIPPPPAAD